MKEIWLMPSRQVQRLMEAVEQLDEAVELTVKQRRLNDTPVVVEGSEKAVEALKEAVRGKISYTKG